MNAYRFRVEVEAGDDGWWVRCPALDRYGGIAWGETEAEARERIQEVLGLVVDSMAELGMPVPDGDDDGDPAAGCEGYVLVRAGVKSVREGAGSAKTYQFRVVVEPDEDQWFACCPALESMGAATGGRTWEEAYVNIHQVLRMTLESMVFHKEAIPVEDLALADKVIAVTL